MIRLHHTHLMATDIEATIQFFTKNFDAKIAGDITFAGARNVFLWVGDGRLHLYDQPPKQTERSAMHHLGIQTDNLQALVQRLKANGVSIRKSITKEPFGSYIMVKGPDTILLELFEVNFATAPPELQAFFS